MRILFLAIACLLLALELTGQAVEICNDGIDNDGNGLVDCADPFCSFAANIERGCNCFDNVDNDGDGAIDKADPNCATYYGLTFVGEGSNCSLTPPGANTPFDLVSAPAAVSGQNTSDTQSKVAVGDIDGDGIPDVAITSKFNSNLRIVATSDGQPDGNDAGDIKSEFNLDGSTILPYNSKFMYEHDVLIADIDKDGKSEIFGIISDRPPQGNSVAAVRFFLVGFRYTINSLTPLFNAIDLGPDRPGIPGIADFEGDGLAEIYLKDEIYAAESGIKLADGGGIWDTDVNAAPVAVNFITSSPNMELVTGRFIYNVPNMSSRTLQTLTIAADLSTIQPYFPKVYNDLTEYGIDNASSTSVADIDEDGFLDVVLSGSTTQFTQNGPGQVTSVFYWNVQKGTVSVFNPPDLVLTSGWTWGTSRINLGDANGDGKLDLTFVAGNRLFCLTTDAGDNLVPLWATPRTINDSNSGIVAVTIYDFDNDGNPELVYRDSQEVVVVDGATGQNKLWSSTCRSHTFTEGPLIADVNGDGGTDICVPCFRGPGAFNINGSLQEQARGEVRLWFSTGNEWLPTRRVWNQPGYFVVNINDDMTLPFPQIDQTLVFGNSPCPNGIPGPNQPLNVFLNQVPNLSAQGCPIFPAPDLTFFGDDPANPGVDSDGDGVFNPAVVVTPPICGNLDISVVFNIVNSGDLPISDNVPVAFFNGDPLNGGTYLHDDVLTIANLQLGQTFQTPSIAFNGPGTIFTLFIILYSDGSLPLAIDNTQECSIANNTFMALIAPDPFTATIEKVSDNFKCDNTAPDNGELRAHIFKGGVETFDFSPYSFQWFNGADTSNPIPDPVGTNFSLTDAAEGTYTLVVTNDLKGCASLPVSETIVRLGNDPEININVLSDQTLCSPANGQLEAVITGGNTGFVFEWFDISLNPLGISGPIANNLTAGNYLVRVSKDGCVKISDPVTINGPQIPDAQALVLQHVIDCSNLNSGSIQANAFFNGVIQDPAGYQFDWYFYDNVNGVRGSILPPANGSGQVRTGLAVGFYQAEVRQLSTQCLATLSPIVEVLDQTIIPTASITQLAPQTSCDVNNPNGILTADVFIGGVLQNPAGFTFEWFRGDNTLPASLHTSTSDVNGKQANNVSGGGEFYTVKVTTANNCFASEKFIIAEDVKIPVVSLVATPNSICDPLKASSSFNGTITATVTFGGVPVADFSAYQFVWHDGLLTSDPIHPVADDKLPVLSGLNNGNYTVTVEQTSLFCKSMPVSEQVGEAKVLPLIIDQAVPSTNCSPGFENGIAEVLSVDGFAVGSTTTYNYLWHIGAGTGTPIVAATSPQLVDLQGGAVNNFTVLVTNNITGCENTGTVLVPDASAKPVVTLTATNNSICDPGLTSPLVNFSGRVEVTGISYKGAPFAGGSTLTYKWWNNNNATGAPVVNAQTAIAHVNLDDGDYSNTVTIDDLGCESDFVAATVIDAVDLPDLVTASTSSTNCIPGLENGAAQVTTIDGVAVGLATNYTYQWHTGVGTGSPIPVGTNATADDPSLVGVQGDVANIYTVLVTNLTNGCRNDTPVLVTDASEKPFVTLSATDNTICTVGAENGSATINTLTYKGGAVVAPFLGYTFAWASGQTTPTLSGRAAGIYSLEVTKLDVGCTSDPVPVEIKDNKVLPDITTAVNGSTNCAGGVPDGAATVVSVIPADAFQYRWYQGTVVNPGAELNVVTNPTITGRQGGSTEDYIVEVTLVSTGCTNTKGVIIPDISSLPTLGSLLHTNNTICLPGVPDGTASVDLALPSAVVYRAANIPVPYTGFTFNWSEPVSGFTSTGFAISNRPAAVYSLTVTHDVSNCISNPVTVEIMENIFIPAIDIAETPQTSCVGFNGILAATIDETAIGGTTGANAGYTFNWLNNGDPITFPGAVVGTTTGTNGEVDQLEGNMFYTVEVERNATRCTNSKTIFLQQIITIPQITSLIVTSQQTTCLPPDGAIQATINPVPSQTYSYYWLKEDPSRLSNTNDPTVVVADVTASPATPNRLATGALGSNVDTHGNLTFGNYTMVAVDNFTQCVSQPQTATILDQTASNINFAVNTLPTSCAVADGALDFNAARVDATPSTFTFELFLGGPTNPITPIDFNSNPPTFDPVLNDGITPQPVVAFSLGFGPVGSGINVTQTTLESNLYSVIATDQFGCQSLETFFLPFLDAHDIDDVVVNSQICPYTIGDGSISLRTIPPPSNLGANQTQFTYRFYGGGVADPANLLTPSLAPAPVELCGNGLDDDGDGLVDGADPDCTNPFNWPLSTEVCNDGVDNDGDGLNNAADPDCTNQVSRTRLAPGIYTIEVEENISASNCKVYRVIEIGRDALAPVVDVVGAISPNTACDIATSADGSAEISIAQDPDDNTVGSTYTLAVSPLSGTEVFAGALGALPFPNPVISGLQPDSNIPLYTLTVTSSNNCVTQRVISVPDQPVVSELVGGAITKLDAEFCLPALETSAQIEVTAISLISGAPDVLDDYRFDWFTDASLAAGSNILSAVGDGSALKGGEILSNVGAPLPVSPVTAASYWVVATKVNAGATGGVGCLSAPFKVDILDHTVKPDVVLTPVSNTACDGNFEGRITLDASTPAIFPPPDVSPGVGATYSYAWTSSVAPPANTIGQTGIADVFLDLEDGAYSVRVTNEVTQCFKDASTNIIQVSPPVFTVSVASAPQVLCTPDGSAQITDVFLNGVSDGGTGNFEFRWFLNDPNTPPLLDGGATTIDIDNITNLNFPTIGTGNYFVRAIRRPNTDPGSGCSSALQLISIGDERVNPVAFLTPTSNTSCDPGFFEGEINVQVTDNTTAVGPFDFNYVWTALTPGRNIPAVPPNPAPPYLGLSDTFAGIEDGVYQLVAINNQTQCISLPAQTTVQKNTTPVFVQDVISIPQYYCLESGRLEVQSVSFNDRNGVSQVGPLADFTYTWSQTTTGNVVASTIGLNPRGTILDSLIFATGAADYYVVATRTTGLPGSGCSSAPFKSTIEDRRESPNVSFLITANTACDNNFDGRITINASNTIEPGLGENYDFEWTLIPAGNILSDALNSPSPYATLPTDVVGGTGNYAFRVTNFETKCFTDRSLTMVNNPQPLSISTVLKQDQLICFPDGRMEVTTLTNGVVADYTYNWFQGNPNGAPLSNGLGTIITPIITADNSQPPSQVFPLVARDYYVKAQKLPGAGPGSGCETPPLRIDILDNHVDPRMQFSFTPNSSCNLLDPNGNVLAQVVANGNNSVADTYSFTWVYNSGVLPPITTGTRVDNNNSSQLNDAFEGNYMLSITNTSNTGCSFTSSLDLNLDLTLSLPNVIDAVAVDPLDCLASGSTTVTRVGIGGTTFFNDPPDDLDLNFDYRWFQGDLTNQIAGEVNHNLLNRLPGTYLVTVTDGTTLCESGPKEVVIKDDQIIFPDVRILQTARQISCLAATGTAALASTADGQDDMNLDYQFFWHNSLDATGPLIATTSMITGQQQGDYSVEVLRVSTGCSSQALYIVPDEAPQFTPVISLGGQGRTLCVGQDGSVLARVIDISPQYPFALDFIADLFNGATPNLAGVPDVSGMGNVPGFATNFLESSLAEGFYTVRVTDNNTGCFTVGVQEVLDQRTPPLIEIIQDNPLTNCDPAIANGQLSATADGRVGGFDFVWFAGSAVASPPPVALSTINKLIGSGSGDFVVRVTNRITGCFGDLAGMIEDETILPPVPDALTVRDRTNCLAPNGLVSASVGGITFGFDFDWYDGVVVKSAADFSGVDYPDLDIGDYTVTATDIITGCISPPATTPVADARRIPEFTIETTPSFCIDTGKPRGNGSVILTLTNGDEGDVVLQDVQWIDLANSQNVGSGDALYELFPGFYQAQAVTIEGCTNEGDAEVKTEITPYNGVSTNSDGSNDKFIVDCISLFPNNNVKIFNRNGIMVYEADGYNNSDISFSGIGLEGIYFQGKELPVGTYFYVIDKRDGSKPLAGFLELDR